jgi:RNA polymerase sigma-70 factor, ECF subfamily
MGMPSTEFVVEEPAEHDHAGLEHIDGLFGYALVLTRNRVDAEDLVQETYVRAIRAMGRLRPGSNVKGWLFTILRNVWLNELRQRRKAPESVDIETDDRTLHAADENTMSPHDAYVSGIERGEVRKAIEQLPAEAREVILLREYEELSYEEIAGVLDCPVGTVMSRLARARMKLKKLLGPVVPNAYPRVAGTGTTK